MRIILAGATGLVGGMVLERLLAAPGAPSVLVLGRRPTGRSHAKLTERIADISEWPAILGTSEADAAICALGTTIRAAGSRTAFEAVDYGVVASFASAVQAAGVYHFLTVSSVGANACAANFYLQTKGRTEDMLKRAGFARLDIFRPGLLRGPRTEFRPGERLAQIAQLLIDPLLCGGLTKYRSIQADTVAHAITTAATKSDNGIFVHHHDDMVRV